MTEKEKSVDERKNAEGWIDLGRRCGLLEAAKMVDECAVGKSDEVRQAMVNLAHEIRVHSVVGGAQVFECAKVEGT